MANSTMADTPNGPADLQSSSPYGYTPTTWTCILFVVLYSLTTLAHLAQAILSRLWWVVPTVAICGLSEIIGWSGRLWSSYNAEDMDPFLMQCVLYWSRAGKGSPTPVQDHGYHYRAFLPHCCRVQHPWTRNSAGRCTVQLDPTSVVYVCPFFQLRSSISSPICI
jgi:hypothetical protein